MDEKKLPRSRLRRLGRLATLGTRAGVGKVASLLGSGDADRSLAETAARSLGQLRGLALKMGQMISYVDGLVPAEHRDTYEEALKSLRAAAPSMSPEASARVIEEELGASPWELYGDWEPQPFAAASIGQVHRATTRDGLQVAVKVQYEGIAEAVEADLDNASLMSVVLGPLGGRIGLKEQLGELRARFLEELDYRHEAARQMQFRELFAEHPKIRVPEVLDELCARRVLTTAFAPGVDFDQARLASEEERRAWAETLWRFVFGSLLQKGLFNADPHPGNYLFEPEGVIHFLDFGCSRVLSRHNLGLVRQVHAHGARGELEGLCDAALTMFAMPLHGRAAEIGRDYVRTIFTPIHHQGPYRITHDYAASLLTELGENARLALTGSLGKLEPMPPEWLFFNRLQLGFYSVLARLDVEVDYNAIERELCGIEARS